jgi:hypothetical protein
MEPNVIQGRRYGLKEVPVGQLSATHHLQLSRIAEQDGAGALDATNLAVQKPLQLQAKISYQSNIGQTPLRWLLRFCSVVHALLSTLWIHLLAVGPPKSPSYQAKQGRISKWAPGLSVKKLPTNRNSSSIKPTL